MIFKKGSSTPSKATMIMLRMIAIGNLFRMSVVYLKNNKSLLREGMDSNPKHLHEETVEIHRLNMKDVLEGSYPPSDELELATKTPVEIELRKFGTLERWLGHDLFSNAIMKEAKPQGKYPMQIFEETLEKDDWKDFQREESILGHTKPHKSDQYPKESKEKGRKRKGNTGKCCCENPIP